MVTFTLTDNVAVLAMDDGKANVLNGPSLASLEAALDQAEPASAIVLTGRAGFFTGGLDLKTLPTLPQPELREVLQAFFRVTLRLVSSPVPVVAAVSGHAMAGGVVMSLGCDYAIGARGPYRMGLNEVAIGVELPPFVMELARARVQPQSLFRALAHGEVFSMEDCLKVGYLDELVEPTELAAASLAKARALGSLHKRAYRDAKTYLRKPLTAFKPEDVLDSLQHFFSKAR